MIRKLCVAFAGVAFTFALNSLFTLPLCAEAGPSRSIIKQSIDETRLVTLAGNTRFEAKARNDRGRVPDELPLDHMLLQLKRPADLERRFDRYIDSLTDKSSPNFRHWLSATEQGEKYGLVQEDLDAITKWLESHGFTVGYVYPNRMVIDFSGTAGQIREAFHTEIHYLEVHGERHIANMSDPQIPEALAPAVQGVVSLHDFRPHAAHESRPGYTFSGNCGIPCFYLVPADLQTIYNLTPLYTAGIYGQGQTVAVIETSNSYGDDWSTYQKTFGLTGYGGTLSTVHPDSGGNCANPGISPGDGGADIEANIDVEMVTALAPGANAELASCRDTSTTFGGLIAIENLISAGSPPAVMSLSYQGCEVGVGAAGNAAYNSAFQSAAAAGVSVFGITGDHGPSLCSEDFDAGENEYEYALSGIGVNGLGSTVYNVAVGGTDFEAFYNAYEGGPPVSTYFGTNGPTYGSAKSYIPEIPWDYSCATYPLYNFYGDAAYGPGSLCNMDHYPYDAPSTWAGGGGPSGCATGAGNTEYGYIEDTTCAGYAKPSWQSSIFGNPADGVRDLPDVSLFAACNTWNSCFLFCFSDVANGGTSCAGAPSTWSQASGTSFAAPLMAAIQALVNQKWNTRVGNPNPTYYAIANSEFGSSGNSDCYSINLPGATNCIFNDITQGDNVEDCEPFGSAFAADCFDPAGTFGALSTQAITSLTLTSSGSGYTGTPTCSIPAPSNLSPYYSPTGTIIYAGGTQATCTATIDKTTKTVSSVTLTNQGEGYTGVPLCTLSGGGGTGATCYAVIDPMARAAAYQPAFGATPGWDMATGLGSVNAYNLINDSAWK
ncbi:MAG: protease pro-enzyme activation domain-containing protein [Candidatus Sulfotelmatobacter sp.]